MSIEAPLVRVESLLDYLLEAEVVDNTFGTIWQLRDALEQAGDRDCEPEPGFAVRCPLPMVLPEKERCSTNPSRPN